MKTLRILIALAIIVVAGCVKDYTMDENMDNLELKKAKVPVPFTVQLCGTPDMNSEFRLLPIPGLDPTKPESYEATRMFLSGIVTHVGRIDSEKSYSESISTVFVIEDGKPYLLKEGTGIIVAKSGDSYRFNGWVKVALPELSFTSTTEIIPGSGTGRFEGITGFTDGAGQVDVVNHTNCWTNVGYMIYE